MAVDSKRRQNKLMKKRQKDKLRKNIRIHSTPFEFLNPKKKIQKARQLPIHECLINASWQEGGLATILLSRQQPNGMILFGVYLVDVFCLGLKNTYCNADLSMSRYTTEVKPKVFQEQNIIECPIELAHQIIYGAIEYAEQFGFWPNKDFKLSRFVLESSQNIELRDEVEFGKDGKPFYISGPDDNARNIIRQLDGAVGRENYDFATGPEMIDVD